MPIPDPRGSKPPGYLPATTQRPGSRSPATIVTPVGASAGARMGLLKKRRSATPGGTAASQQKRSGGGAPVGGGTATTSASYGETTADRLIKDALGKLQTPGEVGGIYDKQAATVAQLGQTWQNLLAANGQLSQGLAQASQRAVVDEALKHANYGASAAVGLQNNGQGVAGSIGAGQAVADTAGANPGVFALSTRDAVAGLRATAPLVVQDRQALVEGKRQSALADLAKQRNAISSTRAETALKINDQRASELLAAQKEANNLYATLKALHVKESIARRQADNQLTISSATIDQRYSHDASTAQVASAHDATQVAIASQRAQATAARYAAQDRAAGVKTTAKQQSTRQSALKTAISQYNSATRSTSSTARAPSWRVAYSTIDTTTVPPSLKAGTVATITPEQYQAYQASGADAATRDPSVLGLPATASITYAQQVGGQAGGITPAGAPARQEALRRMVQYLVTVGGYGRKRATQIANAYATGG